VDRWFVETLYVEETVRLSQAWRMPPPFYGSPAKVVPPRLCLGHQSSSSIIITVNHSFIRFLLGRNRLCSDWSRSRMCCPGTFK